MTRSAERRSPAPRTRRGWWWATVLLRLVVLATVVKGVDVSGYHIAWEADRPSWQRCGSAGCLGEAQMLWALGLAGLAFAGSCVTDVLDAERLGRVRHDVTNLLALTAVQLPALLLYSIASGFIALGIGGRVGWVLTALTLGLFTMGAADLVVRRCLSPRRAIAATAVLLPLAELVWIEAGSRTLDSVGGSLGTDIGWLAPVGMYLVAVLVPSACMRWAERGAGHAGGWAALVGPPTGAAVSSGEAAD